MVRQNFILYSNAEGEKWQHIYQILSHVHMLNSHLYIENITVCSYLTHRLKAKNVYYS